MNTKERIAEIVNEIVVTAFTLGLKNTPAPELYKEVKVDQLLGLFLSEEEIGLELTNWVVGRVL
jgi:hypothetical protein